MKKSRNVFFILFILLITTSIGSAQDLIVLRNGDEILVKVLEIKQTEVSFKNWTNIDGPTYTKNKADIFMIKYSNGSKDIFEQETSPAVVLSNNADKFLGLWHHKNYNGKTNQSVMLITHVGDNYIVENRMRVFQERSNGVNIFQIAGSFKEAGRFENESIIINSDTRLTLVNDSTLIMRNAEYYKQRNTLGLNEEPKIPPLKDIDEPTYTGEFKNGLRHGKGKLTYPGGNYFEGTWVNGEMHGIGTNTRFQRILGTDMKFSTKAYWINNKANLDSLIILSRDDFVSEIGYFVYIENSENIELFNGLRVVDKSKRTFIIEVVVGGDVRKVIRRLPIENPITEENWLKYYNLYK